MRKFIGRELGTVYNASTAKKVQQARRTIWPISPTFTDGHNYNVPDCLFVFSLHVIHQLGTRTSNVIERAVQQEVKRRIRLVKVGDYIVIPTLYRFKHIWNLEDFAKREDRPIL